MSTYTYPSNYVFQSDNSFIVKRNVTFIDCDPTPPTGSCDLFNSTRCGNDECYAQPFISGDILCFQWRFDSPASMSFSLVDEDFNHIVYTVPLTTFGTGTDEKYQDYQWLNIDTSLIPASVDYFHLKVVYDGQEWYSEPFELVNCDDQTVYLVATHDTGRDCFKNYHNNPVSVSATNYYNSQTRIYGTIEKVANSISKEIDEDVEISTTVEQIYLLRTSRKVPQYVADKITEIFSGRILYIDGEIYTPSGRIDKDFEEGKMWIISSELRQTCTKENFKC